MNTISLLKPKKQKKKSSAKKKAWAVFSKYIRHYYADANGDVTCYTCGAVKPINEIQSGHGIGGRNNALLFLEAVVRPQCVGCNVFGRGQYRIFTRKLIDELGLAEYDRVCEESQRLVQYKTDDYEAIYKFYANKLNNL